jgi:formate dehydrogenase subunit gamma
MTATPGSTANPPDGGPAARVIRFSLAERSLHWVHTLGFFGLLVTGVALYLPSLTNAFGSRAAMKAAHLAIAGAWAVGLLVVVACADRGRLRRTQLELQSLGGADTAWLRRRPSAQGRFNAGQKLHTLVQVAFAVLFVLTGGLLLAGEAQNALRLAGTLLVHDGLTVLATVAVLGHLYLALVHPSTRPALMGAVTGAVSADWARRHHAGWKATTELAGRSSRPAVSALLVLAALATGVATVLLIRATG